MNRLGRAGTVYRKSVATRPWNKRYKGSRKIAHSSLSNIIKINHTEIIKLLTHNIADLLLFTKRKTLPTVLSSWPGIFLKWTVFCCVTIFLVFHRGIRLQNLRFLTFAEGRRDFWVPRSKAKRWMRWGGGGGGGGEGLGCGLSGGGCFFVCFVEK
jgi:hypothetical protein